MYHLARPQIVQALFFKKWTNSAGARTKCQLAKILAVGNFLVPISLVHQTGEQTYSIRSHWKDMFEVICYRDITHSHESRSTQTATSPTVNAEERRIWMQMPSGLHWYTSVTIDSFQQKRI
jgi:hypothetical protein